MTECGCADPRAIAIGFVCSLAVIAFVGFLIGRMYQATREEEDP